MREVLSVATSFSMNDRYKKQRLLLTVKLGFKKRSVQTWKILAHSLNRKKTVSVFLKLSICSGRRKKNSTSLWKKKGLFEIVQNLQWAYFVQNNINNDREESLDCGSEKNQAAKNLELKIKLNKIKKSLKIKAPG